MTRGYMPQAKSTEWETPQPLFDSLNREFHFTLDVAASRENAKCEKYFTRRDNGLKQSWWNEIAWMNCPYGKAISDWTLKAKTEASQHGATVVGLLPNRTDVGWFHKNCFFDAEIRLMEGRLKFSGANSATFGSMIVVWSDRIVAPNVVTCDRLGRTIKRSINRQMSLEEVFKK